DVVAERMGWTTGMCAAKGKLILSNSMVLEAKGCEYRSYGPNLRDASSLTVLPEYDDNFGSFDPVRAFMASGGMSGVVDPNEYETDKPVDDDDREAGIRAWRRIEDPESGNHTFLPIFDPSHFSEAEQALIPK